MYRSGTIGPRARGKWLRGATLGCVGFIGCIGDDGSAGGSDGTADDGTPSTTAGDGGADPTSGSGGATMGDDATPATDDSGGSDAPSDDTGTTSPWTTSLEVGEDVGAFLSVWGETVAEVWAVGGQSSRPGALTVGTMWRYDGTAWAMQDLPEGTPTLNWIYGVDGTLATVGDFGTILVRASGADEFTQHSCATILPLWGVWGAAADDLWIVGGDGFQREPVLCHFDGSDVTAVEYPEPSIETFALFKIWGTSADHVFAVGDAGYILHYDGVEWTEQESGTASDLISLWGRGPDEILAVGGRASGVLARWDGDAWTATDLPDVFGLNGVFMNERGVATVVGVTGAAGRVAAGASALEVEDPGTLTTLHAAYAPPDGPVFAVGGSLEQAPPFVGVILTREP